MITFSWQTLLCGAIVGVVFYILSAVADAVIGEVFNVYIFSSVKRKVVIWIKRKRTRIEPLEITYGRVLRSTQNGG